MLSTVGYGDMYPITNLEKILSVIWMFLGVAIFSIIMGQFQRSKEQISKEQSDPDLKSQLALWLNCLKRFNKGHDMVVPSLKKVIFADLNYFIINDRNQYFRDPNNQNIAVIPKKVK